LNFEDIILAGDKVIVTYIATGTHQGEFMGVPPTGKKHQFSGILILKIENGKVVENREEVDSFGFMQQLGFELKPAAKK